MDKKPRAPYGSRTGSSKANMQQGQPQQYAQQPQQGQQQQQPPPPPPPTGGPGPKAGAKAKPIARRRGDIPAYWACYAPATAVNVYHGTYWNLLRAHPGAKAGRCNSREEADSWLWNRFSYDSASWELQLC